MLWNNIKKVELHCHADGTVSPDIIKSIKEQGMEIPVSHEEIAANYPVNTFDEFIKWFEPINPYFQGHGERMLPVLAEHIKNLKTQNVIYSEIMIPGMIYSHMDPAETLDQFQALRELADGLEENTMQIEFLVAMGRNRPVEVIEERAERIIMLHDSGLVVGAALCGLEAGNPVKPYRRIFERLQETGMGIEIHAGEWAGPESVRDAIENGFPDRIGHGVSAFDDPHLLETIQERNIHIEMCPTSNVKTGSVNSIEEHPIRLAMETGMNFSVNTDDPGPFECSLTSEFELLAKTFGFTDYHFDKIRENSLKSRFQKQLRYI